LVVDVELRSIDDLVKVLEVSPHRINPLGAS